jgi:tetratricopeptide (TPR) repeat protein
VARGLLALLGLSLYACATPGPPQQVVELEPLEFRARKDGDKLVVDTHDAEALFEDGVEHFKSKRLLAAAQAFERLVESFPDHERALDARYNAALAREELGEVDAALRHFDAWLGHELPEKDRVEGLLRYTECLGKAERWEQMRQAADSLLALRLTVVDRVSAHTLRGYAWRRLSELARAERSFEAALSLYEKHSELSIFRGSHYVALAHYEIGEIYRALFRSIAFRLPVERMEADLDDKSKLFIKAQHAYLKSIRVKNSYWSVAAGFQIGAIYEEFYDDFLAAEHPPELTRDEVAVYMEELRIKTRPLIERAVEVYERNVMMSERAGMAKSEWAEKSKERLERLRKLLTELPTAGPPVN